MAGEINYKMKYQELKAKFMSSVDMAFRLGFEQGQQAFQLDQMAQQQQQQADLEAQQAAAMGQQPPGGQMPGQEEQQPPDDGSMGAQPAPTEPQGSELDQHIATLESMVNKSEGGNPDLQKALDGLKSLKKSFEFQQEMKKSQQAIPAIARALHKPAFKLGQQANHNMNQTAKKSVNMQEQIVSDLMQKWEQEERKASEGIVAQLSVEGLTKKE